MREKTVWFISGVIVSFFLLFLFGGLYTITPPNGPVDVAYKMNRLTGKIWMIKTYSKQAGAVRVLTAREADVEKTKQLPESDFPALAPPEAPSGGRGR